MSELRHRVRTSGREILQDDLDTTSGDTAGLSVSRCLQQLYNMPAYDGSNVAKGVLALGSAVVTADSATTIGDVGAVLVHPFRAMIGSRTAAGSDHPANVRDIRSGLFVGDRSDNSYHIDLAGDPADLHPRIALIYASVIVDDQVATRTRYHKDISSGVVSNVLLSTANDDTVSVNVVYGTPATAPTYPSLPADGGGVYNVPLAYVFVPNAAIATGITSPLFIEEVAPLLTFTTGSGGASCSVAQLNYDTSLWANSRAPGITNSGRDSSFMPRTFGGEESLHLALDLLSASSSSWNVATGQVVDATRDWRRRTFVIFCSVQGASSPGTTDFAWGWAENDTTATHNCVPQRLGGGSMGVTNTMLMSQSMTDDSVVGMSITGPQIAYLNNTNLSAIDASGSFALWVDPSTGAMKVAVQGTPKVKAYLWIQASAQFANRA